MGPWGYVYLAYGIVWSALLLYLSALKRRYRRAEAELAQWQPAEKLQSHAKK